MEKIYCCFMEVFTTMDLENHFKRAGAEIMLLAQYVFEYDPGVGYHRSNHEKYEYQLWVRANCATESTIANIEWRARRIVKENVRTSLGDLGTIVIYLLGERVSIQDIRQKLEQVFPGVEFEYWEEMFPRQQ